MIESYRKLNRKLGAIIVNKFQRLNYTNVFVLIQIFGKKKSIIEAVKQQQ